MCQGGLYLKKAVDCKVFWMVPKQTQCLLRAQYQGTHREVPFTKAQLTYSLASNQVLLKTEGWSLTACVELAQRPNNVEQMMHIHTKENDPLILLYTMLKKGRKNQVMVSSGILP